MLGQHSPDQKRQTQELRRRWKVGRPSAELCPGHRGVPGRYRPSRKILAILWACLSMALLLAPSVAAQRQSTRQTTTTYPSTDGQQPTGTQTTGGSEPSRVVVAPQFPVFGCGGGSSEGASEARSDLLDKRGPQLPPLFSMSSFAVMGFSRGSWPVAIDYALEEDSLLLVV